MHPRLHPHWNAGQNQQAELLCLQVLSEVPHYAPALHLLGLIAHTVDKLPQALAFMRSACATADAPALYHSNFAEICRLSGKLEEAEQAACRALALDQTSIAAQVNLGIILQELGKLDESLVLLRAAAAKEPDDPALHNNLGNALQCAGLLYEARSAYQAAIERNPEYDIAHANLARLLGSLGQFDAALEAAEAAIDINPHCASAYLHAAGIYIKRNQLPQALRRLDALLNFMPDHVEAIQSRAALLIDAGEADDAQHYAQRAASLAPNSGSAALVLAKSAQALGHIEQALDLFLEAPLRDPRVKVDADLGRSRLLIELGRMQEAQSLLEAVLKARPADATAWLNFSIVKKFKAGDAEIAAIQTLLQQGKDTGLALESQVNLNFALGKAYMDIGDIGQALDCYGAANSLQRTLVNYDGAAHARWIKAIIEQMSPELLQSLSQAGAGDPSEIPVFIIGMPRSGTTLVEQILASHPDIYGAGELRTVQTMIDRIVDDDDNPLPYPSLVSTLAAEDFSELGAYYVASVSALAPHKQRIVDKMPLNFLYAGFIHMMLPKARIIHLRRDPVDTCMSCYCQHFGVNQNFTLDLAELGAFYCQYQLLMQHWRTVLPSTQFMELDYEAVVADLEHNARRLIEFCGLPWNDACLSFYNTSRRVETASMAQVRQPIYGDSIGRWVPHKDRLSPLYSALGEAKQND